MHSIITTNKLEDLKEARDSGLLDAPMLEEFLEQINQYNCGLYEQRYSSLWKTQKSLRASYLASFPSWKDFDQIVMGTSYDLIDVTLRNHFNMLKKLLPGISICRKLIEMYSFTQMSVHVSFEEFRAVKYVLDNIFELKYYISDFKVK